MYLHRLTLNDVGPFVGNSTIDFAKLAGTGLFLLDGPTGAGKSTILDSIVFALYGKVAGPHATSERMNSQFAGSSPQPRVELVFETSAGLFRVVRTPAYQRAKRSGTGTTPQQATVQLWRLATPEADEGELLSNKHGEAEAELLRIVGLSRAQFVQTIVLPQGEFAAFLRATPDDRRDLLQRLFGTHLYEVISRQLELDRKAAQAERVKACDQLAHAITAFGTACGGGADVAQALSELDHEQLAAGIEVILAELVSASESATTKRIAAEECLSAARDDEAKGTSLAERHRRRLGLLNRRAKLDATRSAHNQSREELHRLQEVRTAIATYEGMVSARLDEAAATRRIDVSRTEIARTHPDLLSDPRFEQKPADMSRQLSATADQLAHLVETEGQLVTVLAQLDTAELRQTSLASQVEALTNEVTAIPVELEAMENERDALRHTAAGLDHLTTDYKRAQSRLTAAKNGDEATEQLVLAASKFSRLKTIATDLNDELAQLRRDRIDGIAGELAETLRDGQPCAVCGSAKHPRPAARVTRHATPEKIEHTERSCTAAIADLELAKASCDEIEKRLAALTAISEGQGLEASQLAVKKLLVSLDAAKAASQRLPAIDTAIRGFKTALADAQTLLKDRLAERAAAALDVAALKKLLTTQTAKVEQGRAEFTTVGARVADLRFRAKELDTFAENLNIQASAERAVATREKEFGRVITAVKVEDEATFESMLARMASVAALAERIELYEREQSAVEDGLKAPELRNIEQQPVPNLAALEAATAAVEQAHRAALTAQSQEHQRLAASRRHAAETIAASVHSELIQQQTRSTIRMADVVSASSADNLRRIPLPTYVLRSRFRDVVAAANRRLAGMSDGRYELEHTDEKESKGRRCGLGLLVRDLRADQTRAPGDLSGGETFYTALSLALGLADVVTAEAGGVELGTLFIDEGFGALDGDTLDSVLREIAQLRRGGRIVGLVSHVEELKQRIPDRIEVRRSRAGTSTIHVVC